MHKKIEKKTNKIRKTKRQFYSARKAAQITRTDRIPNPLTVTIIGKNQQVEF